MKAFTREMNIYINVYLRWRIYQQTITKTESLGNTKWKHIDKKDI